MSKGPNKGQTLNEYVQQEVRQAKEYADRGIDGHGRPITYRNAYIARTESNAKARFYKCRGVKPKLPMSEEEYYRKFG